VSGPHHESSSRGRFGDGARGATGLDPGAAGCGGTGKLEAKLLDHYTAEGSSGEVHVMEGAKETLGSCLQNTG